MCILFFFRVGDINWLWLAGIASIVFLVVFALCLLAKCRVSLFTRHAKRKLRGAGSTRKKSVKKADVKEEKGEEKREEEDGEKKTILPVKEDILSMIDTTLGLVGEEPAVGWADFLRQPRMIPSVRMLESFYTFKDLYFFTS